MKIQKILSIFDNCIKKVIKNNKNIVSTGKKDILKSPVTYFTGLDKSYSNFPKDDIYRKTIMQSFGLPPLQHYRISSIVGSNELKSFMKKNSLTEAPFVPSIENIKNKSFASNLHMHTNASDGYLTIESLLNQATGYANGRFKKTGKPFLIAITDHDRVDSAQKAVQIIYNNPEKYKHLKVVLGCEVTSIANKIPKPKMVHTLVYCINPKNTMFKNFLDTKNKLKINLVSKMIDSANENYGKIFSLDEAKDFYNPINKGFTGVYNYVKSYTKTKVILNDIVMKNPEIRNLVKKNNPKFSASEELKNIKSFYSKINGNNKADKPEIILPLYFNKAYGIEENKMSEIINSDKKVLEKYSSLDFSPFKIYNFKQYNYCATFDEINSALKTSKESITGIAHPLDYIKNDSDIKQKIHLKNIYKTFKESLGDKFVFSERYYQSYSKTMDSVKLGNNATLDTLSNDYNIYNTGSLDTHGNCIFRRY